MLGNNNKVKKKIRIPYKNLGDLYTEAIHGEPRINLQAIREFTEYDEMSKAQVTRDIVATNPSLKAGSSTHGEIRLLPKDKANKETINDAENQVTLLRNAGYNVVKTILPGTPGSRSQKFLTHVVIDKDNKEHNIVFGAGLLANKGADYERNITSQIKQSIETKTEHHLINAIKQYIPNLDVIDIKPGYGRRVIRPLDIIPSDVGEIISDVTLVDKSGQNVYVSLKNIAGATISNQSPRGAFSVINDKIQYLRGKSDVLDLLFETLKLDTQKMSDGLNDYVNQTPTQGEVYFNINIAGHQKHITDIIGSAIGYGYFYARENANGTIEVIDLRVPEDLYNFIGEITNINVKYPYFKSNNGKIKTSKSKTITIHITTTKNNFDLLIRNNAGDIVPNVINLIRR